MVEKIQYVRTKKVKLLMRNAQNRKKQIDVAFSGGIMIIFLVSCIIKKENVLKT